MTHQCGLYVRVSTPRQALNPEGSLASQEQRLRAYVDHKADFDEDKWVVTEVYQEDPKSAANTNRPIFQKLCQDIRSDKINTVVCTQLTRLFRSLPDFYRFVDLLEEHNADFISISERFDTSTAQGRAFLKMVLIMAEFERELTAERTVAHMLSRTERGLWNGGSPCMDMTTTLYARGTWCLILMKRKGCVSRLRLTWKPVP